MARDKAIPCPACGKKYKSLGLHWNKSSTCDYPPLSDKQKFLLKLLSLSGRVERGERYKNANVSKTTSNKEYADWLVDQLGFMCRTHTNAHADEAYGHDSYLVRSRSHPWINTLYEDANEDSS